MNPFDYVYASVNARFELMSEKEQETQYLLRYINASSKEAVGVKRIFKFERNGETERFEAKASSMKSGAIKEDNRILLWHGTSTENLLFIMSKGLAKAASNYGARRNGARFGRGLYFSDSFAASAKFCNGAMRQKTANDRGHMTSKYMLLCEVAMGKTRELRSDQETTGPFPPIGFDSLKALGLHEPNPNYDIFMPNGARMPLGQRQPAQLKREETNRDLHDSQYVAYDESQVCIRYIIHFYE